MTYDTFTSNGNPQYRFQRGPPSNCRLLFTIGNLRSGSEQMSTKSAGGHSAYCDTGVPFIVGVVCQTSCRGSGPTGRRPWASPGHLNPVAQRELQLTRTDWSFFPLFASNKSVAAPKEEKKRKTLPPPKKKKRVGQGGKPPPYSHTLLAKPLPVLYERRQECSQETSVEWQLCRHPRQGVGTGHLKPLYVTGYI